MLPLLDITELQKRRKIGRYEESDNLARARTIWEWRILVRGEGSKASANERVSGALTWTFVRERDRDPTYHLLLPAFPPRTLLPVSVNEEAVGFLSPLILHSECSV